MPLVFTLSRLPFPSQPSHWASDRGGVNPFCLRLLAKLNRLSKQGVSPLTSTLTNTSKAFEQVSLIKFYGIDKPATMGRDSNSQRLRPVHRSMLVTWLPLGKHRDAPQILVAATPLIKPTTRIELALPAWEADVLPLYYVDTNVIPRINESKNKTNHNKPV